MENGYFPRINLNFLKAGMPEAFRGMIKKGGEGFVNGSTI